MYIDASDLDIVKGKVKDILIKNQVSLKEAFRLSLQSISDQLLQVGIISQDIHRSPSYDDIIGSFLAGLTFIDGQSMLIDQCNTFLSALSISVGGPVTFAVNMLKRNGKWIVINMTICTMHKLLNIML